MSGPILVTGGSGYVASWVVRTLLEEGLLVHATVRDLSNSDKVKHLLEMQARFPGRLNLFDGSFAQAMQGCVVVIHMASPFITDAENPQKNLIDPALLGTRNVLQQVNATPTVQKVVLTSSVVAVFGEARDIQKKSENVFTEDDWNESSTLKSDAYALSKTLAEREAWRLRGLQNRWELSVINPGFVMGPALSSRADGQSHKFLVGLITGKLPGVPEIYFGFVDVRDVALAHVRAALLPQAKGRFLLVNSVRRFFEIGQIVSALFPGQLKVPRFELNKALSYPLALVPGVPLSFSYVRKNVGIPNAFDNSRSRNILRIQYRSLEKTFGDHVTQLIQTGAVKTSV